MTLSDPNSYDITITVSKTEFERLSQRASAAGQTVTEFVHDQVVRDVRPVDRVVQTVEEKKK